jgi:hypothetical protein
MWESSYYGQVGSDGGFHRTIQYSLLVLLGGLLDGGDGRLRGSCQFPAELGRVDATRVYGLVAGLEAGRAPALLHVLGRGDGLGGRGRNRVATRADVSEVVAHGPDRVAEAGAGARGRRRGRRGRLRHQGPRVRRGRPRL